MLLLWVAPQKGNLLVAHACCSKGMYLICDIGGLQYHILVCGDFISHIFDCPPYNAGIFHAQYYIQAHSYIFFM